MTQNPVLNFAVEKSAIQYIGNDLQRPECILAERDGASGLRTRAAEWSESHPTATQQIMTQQRSGHFQAVTSEASRYLEGTFPNGLAFARNGDILHLEFRHRLPGAHDAAMA